MIYLFFGKDKEIEKLKKEIDFLKQFHKYWDIQLIIASILDTASILKLLDKLTELDILRYINTHLRRCIEVTAKNNFNLKGFELNPEKKELFEKELFDISVTILNLSQGRFKIENLTHEEKENICNEAIKGIVKQIEIFASPATSYNISEFLGRNY